MRLTLMYGACVAACVMMPNAAAAQATEKQQAEEQEDVRKHEDHPPLHKLSDSP